MNYNEKILSKKHPNFETEDGWYLVRCFECPDAGDRGRENYAMAVASGTCAWCGFDINKACDHLWSVDLNGRHEDYCIYCFEPRILKNDT